jgi:hypothetical protein
MVSLILEGQQRENHYAPKVSSIDSIITNLYDVISGEKGEARDWELMKYLFHPEAKLIPTGKNKEDLFTARFLTVDDYIKSSGKWLIENGFHEVEMHRSVDTFGPITQVFSSYESFRSKKETVPFMRGINSIQLLNDSIRWWIINIFWSQESSENPIPEKYLPNRKH